MQNLYIDWNIVKSYDYYTKKFYSIRKQILQVIVYFCLWTFQVLYSPVYAQTEEPLVSRIFIEIRDGKGNRERLEKIARSLIFLREGQQFSSKKFKASVESLKTSNLFQKIDIPDPKWGEELTLTFILTPFRLIKDIRIEGAFPLLEKEILQRMALFTGGSFIKDKLPQQEKAIEQLFINEGYSASEVNVTAEEDPEDGNYIVLVYINKGAFYHVQKFDIKGNQAFSSSRLKGRLSTWYSSLFYGEFSRFVQKSLDEDIKKLIKCYRRKVYAYGQITHEVEKNKDKHKAIITLTIKEGPWYDVKFVGNKEFRNSTLRKDLVFFEKGNRHNLWLRKSIRNISSRYRKAGYLRSSVKMKDENIEQKGRPVRKITITIDEGQRSVTEAIEITGNEVFDDEKIKKQMLTHRPGTFADGEFVPEILEEDKKAIQTLYLNEGYMNTKVKEQITWREDKKEDRKLANLSLEVNEGIQTSVVSVTFKGLNVLTETEELAAVKMKQGDPFREKLIRSDENTLSALISEKGYPHVQVKAEVKMSKDGSEAALVYSIDEGPYVEMGHFFVTGNFLTKQKVILNEVEVKPGQPFSLKKVLKTQRNIRNINALETAHFTYPGLKEEAERVNIVADVEEKKPYFFQIGSGYDTRRKFYVHSKIGDRNLLGENLDSWISGEYSQIGYKSELGITNPRFMRTRVKSTFNLFAEKEEAFNKNFGMRSFGASSSFKYSFLKHFTADLGFRFEGREQFETENRAAPLEDEDIEEFRSILTASPSLTYKSTDLEIRPTKGIFAKGSVDISKGIKNSLDDFFKYRFETRYYFTPLKRLTFALRGRFGRLSPYGPRSTIPDDQLFFLGGTSDVRGFEENKLRFDLAGDAVGGRHEILGSIEARIYVGMNIELATFYDIGKISDAEVSQGLSDFRSSVGGGFRYITPVGPIGLLYGYKLDRKDREKSGRFHFTMGYTF